MTEYQDILDRLDNLKGELALLRVSLGTCQTRCHVERETSARHVKWSVAALTAVLAAAASAAFSHFMR